MSLPAIADSLSSDNRTALLLGDSVIRRIQRGETDTRSISTMLAESAGRPIASLDGKAYNPRVHLVLSRLLNQFATRPAHVFIEINLRSFSPQWLDHPCYRFDDLPILFQRAQDAGGLLPELPARRRSREVAIEEWERYGSIPIAWGNRQVSLDLYRLVNSSTPETVQAQRLRRALQLWTHYGQVLTEHMQIIHDLVDTARLWQEAGVSTTCYVTPINTDFISDIDESLLAVVQGNIKQLATILEQENTTFLPLWDSARLGQFVHPQEVTEHLSASGRQQIAATLLSALPS